MNTEHRIHLVPRHDSHRDKEVLYTVCTTDGPTSSSIQAMVTGSQVSLWRDRVESTKYVLIMYCYDVDHLSSRESCVV